MFGLTQLHYDFWLTKSMGNKSVESRRKGGGGKCRSGNQETILDISICGYKDS